MYFINALHYIVDGISSYKTYLIAI